MNGKLFRASKTSKWEMREEGIKTRLLATNKSLKYGLDFDDMIWVMF